MYGDGITDSGTHLSALAREDRSAWSNGALAERVKEVAALAEQAEAELLRVVGEWDARRAWIDDGQLSATAWLAFFTPLMRQRARRVVDAARLHRRSHRFADALDAGAITTGHIDAMARHITPERRDLFDDHADTLADAALGLDGDDFAVVTRRWARLADDLIDRADSARRLDERGVHLSVTIGGMVAISGLLDPMTGATLQRAIDHFDHPDPTGLPEGARTVAQRRADALGEVARRALVNDHGAVDPSITVNVLLRPEALLGDGRSITHEAVGIAGVGPVGADTGERALCDAWISRVVLGPGGDILDQGRRVRHFTAAQRKALDLRDGGCVWPGCDRPPEWTDAHHLRPFAAGGRSGIDNGALACRPHHLLLHEGGWSIHPNPDGTWTVTSLDGRTYTSGTSSGSWAAP